MGWVVLGINLALALAKGWVALATGSLAVGSEAVNSLADSAYSLVVLGGLFLTTRPPDPEHPHGHERIEPFVSLVVAVGVFGAGGLVLYRAVQGVLIGSGTAGQYGLPAVGVLLITAAVKYGLYRYVRGVAEERRSPALHATALDNRNDILTAGAALAGVAGADAGIAVLDPLAAAVVSIGIFWTGWQIVRDNVDYLVGRAPPDRLRRAILERAIEHPEVHGAHDVVAHYVGPEVDVSLHIEVEGDRTLAEAHEIESEVMRSIRELPAVDDVFVHVDPRELGEWKADRDVDALLEDGPGPEPPDRSSRDQ